MTPPTGLSHRENIVENLVINGSGLASKIQELFRHVHGVGVIPPPPRRSASYTRSVAAL